MAELIVSLFAKAALYSGPFSSSHVIKSATVFTELGKSSSSSDLPIFSRTHAKYKIFMIVRLSYLLR